ncbi:hypothetical protein SADUNF_Sadunf04G0099200 [Salix dunnii]|uniref:Calponin-homology (CH) domain-containing protein n=1 Tax=Salix dunnii TaxID=1413687 RepID=A0A835K945_9ROSI|nr:hypothetical protein SADUNF_Sadunf04G0099200 [Salix dunnii]
MQFCYVSSSILLCQGLIDERAANTKGILNPWERNENHTLCLNSAKAIGCTVVNIGTQDGGRKTSSVAWLDFSHYKLDP